MGNRPGRCYARPKRPYTRQSTKVPKKGYVKGVPGAKINDFEMGKKKEYENKVFLVPNKDVQITHNALESARVTAVKHLENNIGKGNTFFFKIRIYPHNVLRENALATGAGADRFQQGMRSSFGKPIGKAAIVKKNQKMFEVRISKDQIPIAKESVKKAAYKIPSKCSIIVE